MGVWQIHRLYIYLFPDLDWTRLCNAFMGMYVLYGNINTYILHFTSLHRGKYEELGWMEWVIKFSSNVQLNSEKWKEESLQNLTICKLNRAGQLSFLYDFLTPTLWNLRVMQQPPAKSKLSVTRLIRATRGRPTFTYWGQGSDQSRLLDPTKPPRSHKVNWPFIFGHSSQHQTV